MTAPYRDGELTCMRCGVAIKANARRISPVGLPFVSIHDGSGMDDSCNQLLQDELTKAFGKPEVVKRSIDITDKPAFVILIILAIATAVAASFGICAGYSALTASGRIEGCYTRPEPAIAPLLPGNVGLWGRIAWDHDKYLGTFYTFDQAIESARKLGCPIDSPGGTAPATEPR